MTDHTHITEEELDRWQHAIDECTPYEDPIPLDVITRLIAEVRRLRAENEELAETCSPSFGEMLVNGNDLIARYSGNIDAIRGTSKKSQGKT